MKWKEIKSARIKKLEQKMIGGTIGDIIYKSNNASAERISSLLTFGK